MKLSNKGRTLLETHVPIDMVSLEQKMAIASDYIEVELNQNQVDAICSFVYTVGEGNFVKSSLLRLLNDKNFNKAALEFIRWGENIELRNMESKLFMEV